MKIFMRLNFLIWNLVPMGFLFAAFLCLVLSVAVMWEREWDRAISLRDQHLVVMKEQYSRMFDSMNVVGSLVQSALGESPQKWSKEEILKIYHHNLPYIRAILLFDSNGDQKANTFDDVPKRISILDRPYFTDIKNGSQLSWYGPYQGRNSGQWSFVLAQPTTKSTFTGLVAVVGEFKELERTCISMLPNAPLRIILVEKNEGRILSACGLVGESAVGAKAESAVSVDTVWADLSGPLPLRVGVYLDNYEVTKTWLIAARAQLLFFGAFMIFAASSAILWNIQRESGERR